MQGRQQQSDRADARPAGWYDVGDGWARHWSGYAWGEPVDQETLHKVMAARGARPATGDRYGSAQPHLPAAAGRSPLLASQSPRPSAATVPFAPPGGVPAPRGGVPPWLAPAGLGLGHALVALGSLLPWASLVSIFGTLSVVGTEGDGRITLGLGLAGLVATVLVLVGRSGFAWLALALGVGAAAVGLYDLVTMASALEEPEGDDAVAMVQIGIGLWLVVIGAVLAVVASVAALSARHHSRRR